MIMICRQALTSSIVLQNRSFHVVDRTRTVVKCTKMIIARAKRANLVVLTTRFAYLKICKFAKFSLPLPS